MQDDEMDDPFVEVGASGKTRVEALEDYLDGLDDSEYAEPPAPTCKFCDTPMEKTDNGYQCVS